MNVYNLKCTKLDKRYFLSNFIKKLKKLNIIVLYKEKLTLKQLKQLSNDNIELIHIDNWKSLESKKDIIISYGNYIDNEIFKFKGMCDNLIIISISVITKNTISKQLDIHTDKIFSLQNDGINYIHRVSKFPKTWRTLTKEQIISIISREIKLKKILKKHNEHK